MTPLPAPRKTSRRERVDRNSGPLAMAPHSPPPADCRPSESSPRRVRRPARFPARRFGDGRRQPRFPGLGRTPAHRAPLATGLQPLLDGRKAYSLHRRHQLQQLRPIRRRQSWTRPATPTACPPSPGRSPSRAGQGSPHPGPRRHPPPRSAGGRIYRLRCVEGLVHGHPLDRLSPRRPVAPGRTLGSARFVNSSPTTIRPACRCPSSSSSISLRRGLRLDEARHPPTLLTLGLYGEVLLNPTALPLRVVIPGNTVSRAASPSSASRFVGDQPLTTWNRAAPRDYGFYANVNPRSTIPAGARPGAPHREFLKRDAALQRLRRASRRPLCRNGPRPELLNAGHRFARVCNILRPVLGWGSYSDVVQVVVHCTSRRPAHDRSPAHL